MYSTPVLAADLILITLSNLEMNETMRLQNAQEIGKTYKARAII